MEKYKNYFVNFFSGFVNTISAQFFRKEKNADNHIADFISRNHDSVDIQNYFDKQGSPNQLKVDIPLEWYGFQAEW